MSGLSEGSRTTRGLTVVGGRNETATNARSPHSSDGAPGRVGEEGGSSS